MQWEIHVLQVKQLFASPLTFREILVCEQTVPPCPDHIVSHYGNRIGVRTVGIVRLKVRVASREGARDSLSHCPSAQTLPADMPQTGNKASSIFCMLKASLFPDRLSVCPDLCLLFFIPCNLACSHFESCTTSSFPISQLASKGNIA